MRCFMKSLLLPGLIGVLLSVPVYGSDIFEKIDEYDSRTILLQKQHQIEQLESQLEVFRTQSELQKVQSEIQLSKLRKEQRSLGGSDDPTVRAVMGVENNMEAVLTFSDNSHKTFRVGDVLPGGGKIIGITESEVLVSKGKRLITLAYEEPKTDSLSEIDISVQQPFGLNMHPSAMQSGSGSHNREIIQMGQPTIP